MERPICANEGCTKLAKKNGVTAQGVQKFVKLCSYCTKLKYREKTHARKSDIKDPTVGGFIYLIRCEGTMWVKIGKTQRNVEDRLAALQTGNPYKLSVVSVLPVSDCNYTEAKMYEEFAHLRGIGEWFSVDESMESMLHLRVKELGT
ncbi:hypothetical protein VPHD51_0024 [Vibrio phage D51]